jgi:hypothetical protein
MRLVPLPHEQDVNRIAGEPTEEKIVKEVQDNYRDKSTVSSFLTKETSLTKRIKGI